MEPKRSHNKSHVAPPPASAPQSASRVKVLLRRSDPNVYTPSTLPPPPFESEAEVPGLEWWLDAHMALASDLLCLGQALEGAPAARATHAEAVRQLSAYCAGLRDDLYELYCDAAHPRAADLPGFLGALEPRVREAYAWCGTVVALLVQVASQLRADDGPDWESARAGYRQVAAKLPASVEGLRSVLAGLRVDFTSPVEPLRNLRYNVDQFGLSVVALDEALASRFS